MNPKSTLKGSWLGFVVVQSLNHVWLCDPMNSSTPDFPVLHNLPEFAQTHIHWVSDAIQTSHPVTPFFCPQSFPASGSLPMSQLFASGGRSIGASASALILPMMGTFYTVGRHGKGPCGPEGHFLNATQTHLLRKRPDVSHTVLTGLFSIVWFTKSNRNHTRPTVEMNLICPH